MAVVVFLVMLVLFSPLGLAYWWVRERIRAARRRARTQMD